MALITNLRSDLDACKAEHKEANRNFADLSKQVGVMEGKMSVLEAHDVEKHNNMKSMIETMQKIVDKVTK